MLALYPLAPYTLSGDMNESDTSQLSIQQLITVPTGLHLTNPTNSTTGSINTFFSSGTAANPSGRIDYIFPCTLLLSHIASSQVFRTDRLIPTPPTLLSNDCRTASDHLPVLMTFYNPYDKSIRITSMTRSNPAVALTWESVPGQPYTLEFSSNLISWATLATNYTAVDSASTLTTNVIGDIRFFRVYRLP